MSRLQKKCLKSWKKHLKEYEIIRWDESNSSMDHPFIKLAYSQKKWAFVSDYVRLDILNKFGGIYLDIDMLLLKPLDDLLIHSCFLGAEDSDYISCGIIGTVKENEFIGDCLLRYNEFTLEKEMEWNRLAIPKIVTQCFRKKYKYFNSFDIQIQKNEVIIYPSDYFYPLSYRERLESKNFQAYIKQTSYAVHLWDGSWINNDEFYYIKKGNYAKAFSIIGNTLLKRKNLNLIYLKKIVSGLKYSLRRSNIGNSK